MALTLPIDCPHCGANQSAFAYLAEIAHQVKPHESPKAFSLAFSCPTCFDLVGVHVISNLAVSSFATGRNGSLKGHMGQHFRLKSLYPRAPETVIPDHISDNVSRCFSQAADNAKRRQMDAAGAMYRKCLDLATKELDASLAGKNLAPRIDSLHKSGLLTDALKEWAHAIRLDGNDAAHDADELSQEEVAQLASFTDLFLRYAFTLPKQVELRKADAEAIG